MSAKLDGEKPWRYRHLAMVLVGNRKFAAARQGCPSPGGWTRSCRRPPWRARWYGRLADNSGRVTW